MSDVTNGGAAAERAVLRHGVNKYSLGDIRLIAGQFQIQGPVTVELFRDRGNINLHTYLVTADGQEFLLQKVNSDVFTM